MYNHFNTIGLSKDKQDVEEHDETYLDNTLVQAIQSNQGEFIEGLEEFLTNFVNDENTQQEKLNKLNKFQRKIVHKVCDRFAISRDFVDIKNDMGSISLSKTPESMVPEKSVMELYEEKLEN